MSRPSTLRMPGSIPSRPTRILRGHGSQCRRQANQPSRPRSNQLNPRPRRRLLHRCLQPVVLAEGWSGAPPPRSASSVRPLDLWDRGVFGSGSVCYDAGLCLLRRPDLDARPLDDRHLLSGECRRHRSVRPVGEEIADRATPALIRSISYSRGAIVGMGGASW